MKPARPLDEGPSHGPDRRSDDLGNFVLSVVVGMLTWLTAMGEPFTDELMSSHERRAVVGTSLRWWLKEVTALPGSEYIALVKFLF